MQPIFGNFSSVHDEEKRVLGWRLLLHIYLSTDYWLRCGAISQLPSLNWHFSPPLNEISLGLLFHRREETRRANLAPSDAHLKTIIKKDPPFCKQCHGWKWHHHAVAQWCTGHFEPKKGAISCFFFEKSTSINSNHTKESYHHFKKLSILLHLFD